MTILNSIIVPKNLKGGTIWDYHTSIMFQNIKKMKEGPFGLIVPKKIQVNNTETAEVGILSCFQGSGRRFYNFG